MAYKKYFLYKKQYSVDGGITWLDVEPIEKVPSGQSIGTYDTYADCEEGLPTSYNRYVYERANGETGVSECDSDGVLDWYELHQIDENYDTIVKMTIGECIDTIDDRGLGYLKVLSTVDMSNSSVSSIGNYGLSPYWGSSYQTALTGVTFSPMLQTIGEGAFNSCKAIRTINLPNTVTSIGVGAFSNCTALYDISSLSGTQITKIDRGTFSGDTSLVRISIPTTCREIDHAAFSGCTNLRTFDFKNVTTLGSLAFIYCSSLSSVTLTNGTNTIPAMCFSHCSGMTNLSLPNSIITIDDSAFYGCSSLTGHITLPSSLVTLGNMAFWGTNFSSVTLPSNLATIGSNAFAYVHMDYAECLATIPPTLAAANVFGSPDSIEYTYPIYVPDEAYEEYCLSTNWKAYADSGRLKPLSQKP